MYKPTPLQFSKLSATGNDFILLGLTDENGRREWAEVLKKRSASQVALRLCDRHEGIGADGFLILSPKDSFDFAWEFYNSDGSTAEMCGNAARCAGLWSARHFEQWRKFKFQTTAGTVEVDRASEGMISVTMSELKQLNEKLVLNGVIGAWLDSGVPHFVVEVKKLEANDALRSEARELRRHSQLGKAGANVTYFQRLGATEIQSVTFERGVEDFTLACGTGAVAAAAAAFPLGKNRIKVQVPGGSLAVVLGEARPTLIGPAHWIADTQIHLHDLGMFAK